MTVFHFQGLINFVGSHPHYAFIAVLLLALSEAMPVIGTVVPGSTLILVISALATTADIGAWLLLVAAVIGAIAGDGLAFWLGYRYRREMLRGWPLNRFRRQLARSAQFIRTNGVTAVFLARFTAVVRAFVPLVAGIFRMSSRHFYVANVLSALLWSPLHVFPGVLAGIAITVAGPTGTKLGLLALAVLVFVSIVWHLLKGTPTLSQAPLAERDTAPLDSQPRTRSSRF